MASFISLLDAESRRGMSQALIQGGVSREMGANAIQRMLQLVDLGYRRTTLLSDVRRWKEAYKQGELMKYTTMSGKLSQARYVESTWRMSSRYETLFSAKIRDPLTRKIVDRFVTITHQHDEFGQAVDDLTQTKTRGELQEQAETYFRKYNIDPKDIVGPIMPVMGFYNPFVG